jgi:hypothetical protein
MGVATNVFVVHPASADCSILVFVSFVSTIALGGLSLFGNRTKVLAETAASQIGEGAQSAQKAIGETSTGELSLARLPDVFSNDLQLENNNGLGVQLSSLSNP